LAPFTRRGATVSRDQSRPRSVQEPGTGRGFADGHASASSGRTEPGSGLACEAHDDGR
jgi:hypothetical protein